MYILKEEVKEEFNKHKQKTIAEETGIHKITVSKIYNQYPVLEKKVAYCITKFLNKDKEIEDYFDYKEKENR